MKLLVLNCYSNIIYDEPEDSTGGRIIQLATVRSIKKLKEVILKDIKENYESNFENYDEDDDDYEAYKYDFENIYDKPKSYNKCFEPKSYSKCFEQFLSESHEFDLEKGLHIPNLETLEKGKLTEIMDFEVDFVDTSDTYLTEYFKYYIIKLS